MIKLISGFFVLAGLIFSADPAHAQSQWANLSKSMFPAKVVSITLQSGRVIDARDGVKWGNWSVLLALKRPLLIIPAALVLVAITCPALILKAWKV